MIILLVVLIVGLSTFLSQYWNNIKNQLQSRMSYIPHTTENKKLRYLEEEDDESANNRKQLINERMQEPAQAQPHIKPSNNNRQNVHIRE